MLPRTRTSSTASISRLVAHCSALSPLLRASLDKAGYHVDYAVVDAGRLGLPQRRRRVICVACRGRPACTMAAAATQVEQAQRTSVAQFFPGRQWFYHLHRRSWGRCVYDAARHQVPVLRTNCTYFPVDMARYRPRPGDDAPLAQCPPWTTAELGACQGFPLRYSWPPRRKRCRCRFCSSSSVSAASKQIGNAIPGVIAQWGIETMLAVMAPGRWRRAAACLRWAQAARRAAVAAIRARVASAAASHAAAAAPNPPHSASLTCFPAAAVAGSLPLALEGRPQRSPSPSGRSPRPHHAAWATSTRCCPQWLDAACECPPSVIRWAAGCESPARQSVGTIHGRVMGCAGCGLGVCVRARARARRSAEC